MGVNSAEFAGLVLCYAVAALTLLNNLKTGTGNKGASVLAHKFTFGSSPVSCAFHLVYLLNICDIFLDFSQKPPRRLNLNNGI